MELKNITLNYILVNLKKWCDEDKVSIATDDYTATDNKEGGCTWKQITDINGYTFSNDLFQCPELQYISFKLHVDKNIKFIEMEVTDNEDNSIIYYVENDEFPDNFINEFYEGEYFVDTMIQITFSYNVFEED